MELKDFIKTVLVDLIKGVEEAKNEFQNPEGPLICPPIGSIYTKEFNFQVDAMGNYFQKVEFDVAVTVTGESKIQGKVQGKGSVTVLSVSADIDGHLNESSSTVSKIKFHVPIALKSTKFTKT
ncbi:MAG: hypothetical protein WC748_00255 [Legionellales bacterium]|jgi:hypothetical protein